MTSQRVCVRRYVVKLPGLKPKAAGLTIAHITDLHFRRWNGVVEQTRQLLCSLEFDLLVSTGDFSTRPSQWKKTAEFCRRFFGPIEPSLGHHAVLGNHDSPNLAHCRPLPFNLLADSHVRLNVGGSCVVLAGVDQCLGSRGDIDRALDGAPRSAPTILLAHYPSTIHRLPPNRVGLVLAGHTHGGQIRLPGIGCLWPNDRIPRKHAQGLHQCGRTALCVSAGVGVSAPIFARINCPAEIGLIRLECTKPAATGAPAPRATGQESRKLIRQKELAIRV